MTLTVEQFRAALGRHPSGATIITSVSEDGTPVGATVSAFMSLSIDPPLVVAGLTVDSRTAAAIRSCKRFNVHFVGSAQASHALRFAADERDKFVGVEYDSLEGGSPLLSGFDTYLACQLAASHIGGDHVLLVGRVEAVYMRPDDELSPPVAWYRSGFRRLVDLPVSGIAR